MILGQHSCSTDFLAALKSRPPARRVLRARSHLVYPQLAHDDVVHRGGDFLPGVVVVALLKDGVDGTCGEDDGPNAPVKGT